MIVIKNHPLHMQITLLILAVALGLVTTYTDITEKKIKNAHLLVFAAAAVIVYLVFLGRNPGLFDPKIILNSLVGLFIGFVLYGLKIWRGGDAKLFAVFSLLLCTNKYDNLLPLGCFVLFINTFVIALIAMLPPLVVFIIQNRQAVINEFFSKRTIKSLAESFIAAFALSWMVWPLLLKSGFRNNVVIGFTLLYTGYSLAYRFMGIIKRNTAVAIVVIAAAMLARYSFLPQSFSSLKIYLKYVLTFSVLFYLIRIIIKLGAGRMRVPFAPFVFLGYLLSYTGFLWALISFLKR